MSVQVEKLEKNMAKLTVEVSAEDFKAAIKKAFNKNKNRFAIPGFRKGKAPQAMIEKMYGEGVFYEDAADEAINASYAEAMKESGLDIVSRPEVTIEKIGKDEPFVYSALVAVKPEVTLGQYKGVEVEKADASVSNSETSDANSSFNSGSSFTLISLTVTLKVAGFPARSAAWYSVGKVTFTSHSSPIFLPISCSSKVSIKEWEPMVNG